MNINATIIGQIIAFLFFVLFTMKYIWPPIIKAMQDRHKRISDGLEAAKRGQRSLKLAQQKSSEIIGNAKSEASKIVEHANLKAMQMVERGRTESRQEGQKLLLRTREDVAREIQQAKKILQSDLSDMVVEGVSVMLADKAKRPLHRKLLDSFLDKLDDILK